MINSVLKTTWQFPKVSISSVPVHPADVDTEEAESMVIDISISPCSGADERVTQGQM